MGLFQYRAGSCRVLEKKSRSGQVQLEVLKYSITYFWVTYLILGISGYVGISEYFGYFRVFWVFPGISGYFRVCRVFLGISGFTHIY